MIELEMIIDKAYEDHQTRHGRNGKKRQHPTREEYGDIFKTGMLYKAAIDEIKEKGENK